MIFARLIGLDDEIVRDGWRLRHIEPLLRLPIVPRLSLMASVDQFPTIPNVANYILQSSYAVVSVDAMNAPPDVELRSDFTVKVLYLRYRRRV